jgi:hypothetical protein
LIREAACGFVVVEFLWRLGLIDFL